MYTKHDENGAYDAPYINYPTACAQGCAVRTHMLKWKGRTLLH